MNTKNFNPFERHVEKITLAVAAVGAAYLIYLAWPLMLTIDTPGGGKLAADKVEDQVTAAVENLDLRREETRKNRNIVATIPDYVDQYNKRMQQQPLAESLVDASIPSFLPRNLAVDDVGPSNVQHDLPIATPEAPSPTDVSGVTWRGVVALVQPAVGPGNPPPIPADAKTADKDLVLVKGFVDLSAFLAQMANPKIPEAQRLPQGFQRAVICGVQLQRRIRTNGGWSAWEDVKPPATVASTAIDWDKVSNSNLEATVKSIDDAQKQITQPEYFPMTNGGSAVQLLVRGDSGVRADAAGSKPPFEPAAAPPRAPAFGPGPFIPEDPGRGTPRSPGPIFAPPAVSPAAPAPGAPAAEPTAGQSLAVPVWALDDSVEPGKEYEYRMRVSLYNPTYRWPHALKDPAMKDKPTLESEWVMAPNALPIKSNLYFFIMGTLGNGGANNNPRVTARVYKWNAGRWYNTEVNALPGLPITASMKLGTDKPQDVSTDYTVVDVIPAAAGNDVTAVLMDPAGELVTRVASMDRSSHVKQEIDDEIKRLAPTTQPATRPGGTRLPGTTPPGPGGTRTRGPWSTPGSGGGG